MNKLIAFENKFFENLCNFTYLQYQYILLLIIAINIP